MDFVFFLFTLLLLELFAAKLTSPVDDLIESNEERFDSIDDCDHADGDLLPVGVRRLWFCTTRPTRLFDNLRPFKAATGDAC